MRASLCYWFLLLIMGCGAKTGLNVPDAVRDTPTDRPVDAPICLGEPVDVLFIVDNSRSMGEEQNSLADEIPRLVEALIDPPDLDNDGQPDWVAVDNLQMGVINTDLGVGQNQVGSCERPVGGDGILRNVGNPQDAACRRAFPSFLSFGGDPDTLIRDLKCLVLVGDDGCGLEQPLEAALKALSSAGDVDFVRGQGHGDGQNAGFLRDDSFLVLVVVSDEDDCSTPDLDLFITPHPIFDSEPNLRCYNHPEALFPVQRYVDGFLALRDGNADRIALSIIAGVPLDLASQGTITDFDRIANDPRMQYIPEPPIGGEPAMPRPSCQVDGRGTAAPPTRLIELAEQLTVHTTVQSICQEDFRPAGAALVQLIRERTCM